MSEEQNGPLSSGSLFAREMLLEIIKRGSQAFIQANFRFPTKKALGFADVRAALLGVILRKRFKNNLGCVLEISPNSLRKLENSDFLRIANIHGGMFIR